MLKVIYGFWLFTIVPSFFLLFYTCYALLTPEGYDDATGQYGYDPEIFLVFVSIISYPFAIFMWVLMGRLLFERGVLAFRQYDLNREMLEELKRR